MNLQNIIVFLGPPGAGKSQVSDWMSRNKEIAVIEIKELLRDEENRNTALGKQLKPYLEKGIWAPSNLVSRVIDVNISNMTCDIIIFDDYPKKTDEIAPFFKILAKKKMEFKGLYYLDISRETALKRLSGRRVCPGCSAVYNLYTHPPEKSEICDRCGENLILRKDDEPQIVQERLDDFIRNTVPVIEYFKENHPEYYEKILAEQSVGKVEEDVFKTMARVGLRVPQEQKK